MKILFQGDSVTDAGRDRSDPHDMGNGYPRFASAMIQDSFPDTEFEFIDLGISGNRTEHLVERMEADFIEIQPDIVSILIGVNDVWHHYAFEYVETTDEQFESNYRTLLDAIPTPTLAAREKEPQIIRGEVVSPIDPAPGCRFAARCPHAAEKCRQPQQERELRPGHVVMCCRAEELTRP